MKRIDPGTGNVAGRITDRDSGQPLFGVSLTVGRSGIQAKTDLRGRYFVSNVPSGECTVQCVQPGYKTLSALKMIVRPGETVQQDCQLVCKNRIPLTQPVVLLPLRLEIHKLIPQPHKSVLVANYSASTPNSPASFVRQFEPLLLTSEIQPLAFQNSEYWIRWYPDSVHYLTPVGMITKVEKTAWGEFFKAFERHKNVGTVNGLYKQPPYELRLDTLKIYYGTTPGKLTDDELGRCKVYDEAARELIRNEGKGIREALGWQDLENPETKASWIAFVKAVGPIRARQIAKHMIDGNWDFDTEDDLEEEPLDILMNRGIPLTSLPEEISLYTINNRRIDLLVDGIDINRNNLFIAPTDFEGSQWMTDFRKAVQEGMGAIVNDPGKVQQLDQADWLIAVGVNQTTDAKTVLEDVLRRNNAKGEVSILAQDSATNNTESTPTQYSELESDAETYLRNTYMRIPAEDSSPDLTSQLAQNRTDSQRLTYILKLSNSTLSEISGANFAELTEAAAMAALLWTPCTWHYQQLWSGFFNQYFPGMSRFLKVLKPGEFFVNNVRARGTLPIIRIEENPYGILPVISLRDWSKNFARNAQIPATDAATIYDFIDSLKNRFLSLSENAPKLDVTTDEDKYETLVEILKSAPIAKRVDVRAFDSQKPADMSEDPKYLNCSLVRDKTDGTEPSVEAPYPETAYLNYISRVNQSDFDPDSFQIDVNSPLLKRILKYFLGLIFVSDSQPTNPDVKAATDNVVRTASLNKAITPLKVNPNLTSTASGSVKFPDIVIPSVPQVPGGLNLIAEAASLLKRVHPDKLEILLLETLDLFSHRLDAWFTGLANSMLEECQRQNKEAPPIGMYGWLEKPGKLEVRSIEPEFIQAPSVKQATTAAILRNASIHNGTDDNSGAFQINLSSEQIRKGTWYMEGLRQGHLPGELLGYRLERMIHEESKKPKSQIEDIDIFDLRDRYPLTIQETKDETGESTATLTIIDGEKFLNDHNTAAKFNEIKAALNRIKDAAADIALCEVIDANDNVARQGGWMDFLDGDGLPPREEFIRSQRSGDVHGTKVFLPLPSPPNCDADAAETNPRIVADPILARFCETLMPDFGAKEVVANLSKVDGTHTRPISFLVRELGMHPIDLVVGGFEELKLRTRYHLLSCWKQNDPSDKTSASPCNILGPFPDFEKSDELLNEVGIELIRPATSADKLSIFNYIEKARLIRQLIHQNRSKNSLGTVPPEDLPLLSREQVDKVDPAAGFELLARRLRRLRDQLIRLISTTVTATSELKRRHVVVRGLIEFQTCIARIKDKLASSDNTRDVEDAIKQLKGKVSNLIDTDPDFRVLADTSHLALQIEQLSGAGPSALELIENMRAQLLDLEKQFVSYLENSAKTLVTNPALPLLEISRFGLEQALTVLPEEPTIGASVKIVKLFDQLISSLIERLLPLISESPDARTNLQCLKVVYLNGEEINEVLNSSPNNANAIVHLRNRLPLTEEQLQIISSRQFETASYFEPLLSYLVGKLRDMDEAPTSYEELVSSFHNPTETMNRQQLVSTIKSKTPEIISLLQATTDREGMVVLTPYLLTLENGSRPDWTIDLSQLFALKGPAYLQEYQKLRPAVATLFELFEVGTELRLFEDKRDQRVETDEVTTRKQGNTDFLYLMPSISQQHGMKCLTFLLVDQWQEGIPNPEGSELTGIALRYESPQTEAPNAVLIAVPPYQGSNDFWSTDLLANTLLETIELMQIRLVGSDEVRSDIILNWLFHFPATFFPPAKDGTPLFPSRSQLFHGFDLGTLSGYVLANKLSSDELSKTAPTSTRSEAPKIGGNIE
jgi:hypothetical protein